MRRNWLTNTLLVLAVALLLTNAVQTLRRPSTASAQTGSGRWKVMVISTGENGAKQLEDVLNNPNDQGWNQVTLHMPGTVGGQAVAILKR